MSLSSNQEKVEPNLTALLDIVLQMVMFFMLCSNFVAAQLDQKIKLPTAIAAKSVDKNVRDFLILNIDDKGVTTIGTDAFETPGKIQSYLGNQLALDKARTKKAADWEAGYGRSLIILRAHKDCHYKQVHDVMEVCRRSGYSNVQLRALLAAQ